VQAGRAGAGGRERPASRSEVELADTLGCTIPWMGYCTTQRLALPFYSCPVTPVNRHRRGHRLRRRRLLRGGRWQDGSARRRRQRVRPEQRAAQAALRQNRAPPVRRLLRSRGARGPGLPRAHAADGQDGHLSAVPGVTSPIVHHSLIATDRRAGPRPPRSRATREFVHIHPESYLCAHRLPDSH
jgi:hypothetical protein